VDFERNMTGVLAVMDTRSQVQPFILQIRDAIKRAVPLAPLTFSGVTNAASMRTGAISPGELLVLFGQGLGPATLTSANVTAGAYPTEIAQTRVLVDGAPAPLVYVCRSVLLGRLV
jgi:hypothetical protein